VVSSGRRNWGRILTAKAWISVVGNRTLVWLILTNERRKEEKTRKITRKQEKKNEKDQRNPAKNKQPNLGHGESCNNEKISNFEQGHRRIWWKVQHFFEV
jgi:hypothetical protein